MSRTKVYYDAVATFRESLRRIDKEYRAGLSGIEKYKGSAAYTEELKKLEKDGEKSSQRQSRIRSLVENIKDNSEERGRKIILFELLGMAYADSDFAEEEKEFIQSIKEAFGIEDAFVEKTSRLLESYMELQEKITKHVLG